MGYIVGRNEDSKVMSGQRKRKVDRYQKRTKKDTKSNETENKNLMEQRTKAALKNKIKIQSNTSSSSALSSLMDMVQCKAQDRLREHEETDLKNVETNQPNLRHDDMGSEITETTNEQIADRNVSDSSSYQSSVKDNMVVRNTDSKILTDMNNESTREIPENDACYNSSRKRSYPNTEKQPTTTESKFFRFSALAKELSGR